MKKFLAFSLCLFVLAAELVSTEQVVFQRPFGYSEQRVHEAVTVAENAVYTKNVKRNALIAAAAGFVAFGIWGPTHRIAGAIFPKETQDWVIVPADGVSPKMLAEGAKLLQTAVQSPSLVQAVVRSAHSSSGGWRSSAAWLQAAAHVGNSALWLVKSAGQYLLPVIVANNIQAITSRYFSVTNLQWFMRVHTGLPPISKESTNLSSIASM